MQLLQLTNIKKNYKLYKPLLLFIAKAALIYYTLKYLYLGYVGLADPSGRFNLEEYFGRFNLIVILTQSYVTASEFILNVIGYATQSTWKILRIIGSNGVQIEFACLGVELWIAFIALIAAYPLNRPDSLKVKAMTCFAGVSVIFALNVVRVVSIIISNYKSFHLTQAIHDIFNYTVYAFIALSFYFWLNRYSKKA